MATHRFQLDSDIPKTKIGFNTFVSFDPEVNLFKVYWRNDVQEHQAKLGEHFAVTCNGVKPEVKKWKKPNDPVEAKLWFAGFFSTTRVHEPAEFQAKLKAGHKQDEQPIIFMEDKTGEGHLMLAFRKKRFLAEFYPYSWCLTGNVTLETVTDAMDKLLASVTEQEEEARVAIGVERLKQKNNKK